MRMRRNNKNAISWNGKERNCGFFTALTEMYNKIKSLNAHLNVLIKTILLHILKPVFILSHILSVLKALKVHFFGIFRFVRVQEPTVYEIH